MSRSRSRFKALLLLALLPIMASCAGDDADTIDPAVAEAIIQLQQSEAGSVLAAALAEARSTDRLVFLHTGADW